MNVDGLILAAGKSQRMGISKANLTFPDGKTLLSRQVDLLKSGGCKKIFVVVGADENVIKSGNPKLDVKWIVNENWETGQFSSLQAGLGKVLKSKCDGALILPIDTVGIKKETVKKLVYCYCQRPFSSIIPTYQNRPGHPVLLNKDLIDRILKIDPSTSDARLDVQLNLLHPHLTSPLKGEAIKVEVDDPFTRNNINSRSEWTDYIKGSSKT